MLCNWKWTVVWSFLSPMGEVHMCQWTAVEWQLRGFPNEALHQSPWESPWWSSVLLKNCAPDEPTCFRKTCCSMYCASEISFSSLISFFLILCQLLAPEMKAIRKVPLVADLLFSRDKILLIGRRIYVAVIWNKKLQSVCFGSQRLLLSLYIQRGKFNL